MLAWLHVSTVVPFKPFMLENDAQIAFGTFKHVKISTLYLPYFFLNLWIHVLL